MRRAFVAFGRVQNYFYAILLLGSALALIIQRPLQAAAPGSDIIVTVRHAPAIDGRVEGSVQQLTGENLTLNGSTSITSALLVLGTPSLSLNGHPNFGGSLTGTGGTQPSNYQITLSGSATLGNLITRTDPVSIPAVSAPPSPVGTRDVTISQAGQGPGDFSTLRNLTLNGNVGSIAIPPGTYGAFTASGGSSLILGVVNATQPAIYNLSALTLNGGATLTVVGPVIITSANSVTLGGNTGVQNNPGWTVLHISGGGLTVNGTAIFYGNVLAPVGHVIVNGNTVIQGSVTCDRLTVNGSGLIKSGGQGANQPPMIGTAAAATPNPATGTTTALSVLGADDAGESSLTYTWQTSGAPPAPVTFTVNGSNAAQHTTATFTRAGAYTFLVTVVDAGGLSATSTVNVTVNQTVTSISLAPLNATTSLGGKQQFVASAVDQFGNAMTLAPTDYVWAVNGGGSIDATGLFTAGQSLGGPFNVTATNGGRVGAATVTVADAAPTVATVASATPNPVTGTQTTLSVRGADDGGENNLSYTWSTTGTPPAPVSYSVNSSNVSKTTLATFSAAGTYQFNVTITDPQGLTANSGVSVVVNSTYSSITVSPVAATVNLNGVQQFTAVTKDQFGAALAVQPANFTWAVAGGGTIDQTGRFVAGITAGGPFNVTASYGGITGTSTVTVDDAVPTIQTSAAANPSPVSGTFTTLTVKGADDGGEPALIYTWQLLGTPPAPVTFSANGTNAARTTMATFTQSGSYNFQVTIADAAGQTVTGTVVVPVNQTLTSVEVSPANATVNLNGVQQFTASANDQFGNAMIPQPLPTWSVNGGGSIDTTGLFTAGVTAGGPFVVTASISGITGAGNVSVVNAAPTVFAAANANPNPTSSNATTLSVLGADDGGEGNLRYTWDVIGAPPGPVNYSVNATNASKTTTAFFVASGSYDFQVTITDGGGLSATSAIRVVVSQSFTSVTVAPQTATVKLNGIQSFSATANDQFGLPLTVQPTFSDWSVTGGGTIDTHGTFTAGTVPGGPFIVTATNNGISGTANLSIVNAAPTIAIAASADANPVTTTSSILSVKGADDGGEENLTYTWQVNGNPPAPVAFSANNTNASRITTATFTASGVYNFKVTVTDAQGLTASSAVAVTVTQALSTIAVAPTNVSVNLNNHKQFTVSGADQFSIAMNPQPAFTWTVNGGGTIDANGLLTAAPTTGGPFTVTASANGKSGTATFSVTDSAPSVATAAAANPNPVSVTTTALSVLGADDGGEPNLTYTWAAISNPPAPVTFDVNGSNAAKNATGTFAKAGTYYLQVTITDQGGLSTTSEVTVIVNQTFTSVSLQPAIATVNLNGVQQFTAVANDQFGFALGTQPAAFTWTVSGGGYIDQSGKFTAGNAPGGPFAVVAASSGKTGTAAVTIVDATPTIAIGASATPNPTTSTTTFLSVLGADDGGEANLIYTWTTSGTPPATVTFSANGSHAARNSTATFTKAGTYNFLATITDAAGHTAVSTVIVVVNQNLSITVTPANPSVALNGIQLFTAVLSDQFGPVAAQPTFTWAVTGGGTIDQSGKFTAGATPGGPFAVSATSNAVSGTANVSIVNTPPTLTAAASAAPNPTITTTTQLTVSAADDGGNANLSYAWVTTGAPPAPVTFNVNGTNAANSTTATFTKTGSYDFRVTITDSGGLSISSTVSVVVNPTYSVVVSPAETSVNLNQSTQFTAVMNDQFGQLAAQPAFTWSVDGGGTIDNAGLFKSGGTPGGPFNVTAASGTTSGTGHVTVQNAAPTVVAAAAATPNPVIGTTTTLSVLGADDGGEANLTYTWATTGNAPAPVSFSANASNAAKSSTATFTKAGTYTLQVTIADASGLSSTSSVVIVVNPTPTSLTVTPALATVNLNGTQQYTAVVFDQFSNALTVPPVLTWTVAGGGAISSSGLFTAGTQPGGPFVVTAMNGAIAGTANVSVQNAAPTVFTASAAAPNPVLNATSTTLTALGADDGGEPNLTYTWSATGNVPGAVTFNANASNTAKSTVATVVKSGLYNFQVTIADAFGLTATSTVSVLFNQAPVVNAGGNQTVRIPLLANGTAGVAGLIINGTVTDDGFPNPPGVVTTTWSKITGPGTVVFTDATKAATGATFTDAGSYVLRLTASDSQLSASADVTITVTSAIQPPIVSAGPDRIVALPSAVALNGSVKDDSKAPLTITWSKVSGPSNVTFVNGSTAATSATFGSPGIHQLRLTVNNGTYTASSDVSITVLPATNQPPVVIAGPGQTIALPNVATLNGTITDDGLPNPPGTLTAAWSKVSGPGVVAFGNQSAAATNAAFSVAGTYVLRLTGNDSQLSSSADVTIVVTAQNQAPIVSAGADQTIRLPNSTVSLQGGAVDDGLPNPPGTLTYTWSKLTGPGTVTFANASAPATTATFSAIGVYVLKLTANDSALSASANVTITVKQMNQAPIVSTTTSSNTVLLDYSHPLPLVVKHTSSNGYAAIGFSYHNKLNKMIASVNYGTGAPFNFGSLNPDGTITQFSTVHGLTDEVYFDIAKDDGGGKSFGGFTVGELVAGTGQPGAIIKISADGTTFQNPWVTLPGEDGLFRGAMEFDRTGLFGGDLIAITNTGHVWRVTSAGVPTRIANISGVFLEGIEIIPNDVNKYGPWAGKIVTSGEQNLITYAIGADGSVATFTFGYALESVHIIPPNQDFYVTDASGPIDVAPASQLQNIIGDLIVTDENGFIYDLRWNGAKFVSTKLVQGSSHYEGSGFAPAPTPLPYIAVDIRGVVTDDGLPNPPAATHTSWSKLSGPGNVTFGNPNALFTTAAFSGGGTYVLRLSADDSDLVGTSDVTINVVPPPNTIAGPSQTISLPSKAQLTGTLTDPFLPTNALLMGSWSVVKGPGRVLFNYPSYDMANDFSLSNNIGPWSYGMLAPNTNAFTPTDSGGAIGQGMIHKYDSVTGANIIANTSTNLQNYPGVEVPVAPNQVLMFSSSQTIRTCVRWTAPADGTYLVAGSMLQTETLSTIVMNSSTILYSHLSVDAKEFNPFSIQVTVNKNDTIDFTASIGTQPTFYYFTEFTASITDMQAGPTPTAAFSTPGIYELQFSGNNSLLSSYDYTTINVLPANAAPIVSAGSDQIVNLPVSTVSLSGSATDDGLPAGAPLTPNWSVISGPAGVTFDTPNAYSTKAHFTAAGVYTLQLAVSDTVAVGTDSLVITLAPQVNTAPIVNAGSDQLNVTFPNKVQLSGSGTDDGLPNPPGNLTLAWSMASGPGTATFDQSNAAVTGVTFSAPGNYVLKLSASDGQYTSSSSINIATSAVNHAPIVNAGKNFAINLPNIATLIGTATDDGLPNPPGALTTTWAQATGPGVVTFANSNSLNTTASFSLAGVYVLSLTASDSALSTTSNVTITVNPPGNQAPVVTLGPDQTVRLPNSAPLTISIADDGLPNPPGQVTVSFTQVSGPGTASFNSVQNTVSFSAPGVYVVRITANDSRLSGSADTTITVLAANKAPVISAGGDFTISVNVGITLNGTASDDGLPNPPGSLAYAWSQVSGPANATIGSPQNLSTFALFPVAGNYTIRLQVSDGQLVSTSDVHVTAVPGSNHPLRVSASASTNITVADTDVLNVSATNYSGDSGLPVGDVVTFNFSKVSGPGNIIYSPSSSGTFTITTTDPFFRTSARFTTVGTYVISAQASDGQNSSSTLLTINVQDATNSGPTVSAGPNQTANVGDLVNLSGAAIDDGYPYGTLSYQWLWQSGGAGPVVFGDPTSLVTTATFGSIGFYTIQLQVSDGQAIARSSLTVNVISRSNQPPTVNAGPDQTIQSNTAVLSPTISDDGLPSNPGAVTIIWSKISGPGSVQFGALTPTGGTTATFGSPGTYQLRLVADDGALTAQSSLNVTVNAANQAPVVVASTSTPAIPQNSVAQLTATASDDGLPANPGALSYAWSQVSGPGTVTFTNLNALNTSATFSTQGAYTLSFTANDGALSTSANVQVLVLPVAQNKAPTVSAGPGSTIRLPINTASLNGSATDDGLPNPPGALTYTWSALTVPTGGAVTFANAAAAATSATFTKAGLYTLQLAASDGALTGTAKTTVRVYDPLTGTAPTVSIDSLQVTNNGPTFTSPDGAELTAPTDVYGTVSAGDWTLSYAPVKDPDNIPSDGFTTFATGSGALTNAKLGQFDPTLLLNGSYAIQLTSTLSSGESAAVQIGVICEKNLKVGNFSVAFNDCTIPIAGLPITCTRTYDTRAAGISGDFGYGWRLAIADIRLEKTANLGKFWFQQGDFTNFLGRFSMVEGKSHKVTITFPDGKTYKFQGGVTPGTQFASAIDGGTYTFTPIAPTLGTLTVVGGNDVFVNGAPDEQNTFVPAVLQDFHGNIFNPTTFQFVTQEGMTYVIDQFTGLKSMTDLNGNTITVTPNGLISSTGKSIVFQRDGSNRITSIEDCAGNTMNYAYDGSGNLISFTDRENNRTQFTFDNTHKLISIIDPRGVTPQRNNYDDSGRLISTTDANGKTTLLSHNLTGRVETITDRNGNPTTFAYDNDGNVLTKVDALGAETDYTYDLRDNQLTMKDPLGHIWAKTYDINDNMLTDADPLGNTTVRTFDARRHILTSTDPNGNSTTTTYEVHSNISTITDAQGNVTTFNYNYVFNPAGDPTSMRDANGNTWQTAYDTFGNKTTEIDPYSHIVQYSFDVNNMRTGTTTVRTSGNILDTLTSSVIYDKLSRPTQLTYFDGSITKTTYNQIGKADTSTDQLGHITTYRYDDAGHLTSTQYADGTSESTTFDAEDHRLTTTDRAGHNTSYSYDPLGRSISTTYADSTLKGVTYDLSGRVTSIIDELGNVSLISYDAANRRIKFTDQLSNSIVYSYDAVGNQISTTDANMVSTSYIYDKNSRLEKTIFNNGTFTQVAFDSVGRRTSFSDQDGKITRYGYDNLGRLTTVTDAEGQVTSYEYDELGDEVSQIDANNNRTSFTYDKLGRRKSSTLPLGMIETYSYDNSGSLIAKQDYNGKTTTYAYDSLKRLLSKSPDISFNAPKVQFTYTSTGRRASMTDASGVTTYEYDSRDRLISKTTPAGTLTYTIGKTGNIRSVRSSNPNGLDIAYDYDLSSRLSTVTDNRNGDVTTYNYDNANHLKDYIYPNGVRTAFSYDSLNRLIGVGSDKNGALSNFSYTLGPTGNRLSISELSGRAISYGYDEIYRLKSETISNDLISINNGVVSYQYDHVGNRLSIASNVAAIPPGTSTYDQADRLNSDIYDANGSTLVSNGSSYAYDFERRIIDVNNGQITITYDGDGNRSSKTVNGVTTKYLIDTNSLTGYAQVVEELDGNNNVGRVYTFGDHLIGQSQLINGTWVRSFYGYDGLGSVRFLMDNQGILTDTYTYDAFGNLIEKSGATPNHHLYAGEELDSDLGLYYLRSRYLNPSSGRFLTQDAFGGISTEPRTLHKYAYVGNSAPNRTDPSGLLEFTVAGVSVNATVYGVLVSTETGVVTISGYTVISAAEGIAARYILVAGFAKIASTVGVAPPIVGLPFDVLIVFYAGPSSLPPDEEEELVNEAVDDATVSLNNSNGSGSSGSNSGPTTPSSPIPKGGVYALVNKNGEVMRTGRTNDLVRREGEHGRDHPDLDFQVLYRTDDYKEQRGLEQVAHDEFNPPLNYVNPISPTNKNRDNYILSALEYLIRNFTGD